MQAGIAATIRNLPSNPRPVVELHREHMAGYVLADELGYSHIWLAEHHLADGGHNPSAVPILSAVAARTRRIRVGTCIPLLASHNPILVAESAARILRLTSVPAPAAVRPCP